MVFRLPTNALANLAVTLAKLARAGTAGQVLTSNGAGADASWQDPTQALILPRGYIDGFILANDATDATNDLVVSPGQARDSANGANLTQTAAVTKQIDVAFAEYSAPATPSGGRDSADNLTGQKWFHVFVIGGAGKNTQPFFSTSLTPTLPSGFTTRRRVGSILWTGSAIRAFTQFGDEFLWAAPVIDNNATSLNTTGQTLNLTVPTGVQVYALLVAGVLEASRGYALDTPDMPNLAVSGSGTPKTAGNQLSGSNENASTIPIVSHLPIRTNTSGQIRGRTSNATTLFIQTRGWIDPRGKE